MIKRYPEEWEDFIQVAKEFLINFTNSYNVVYAVSGEDVQEDTIGTYLSFLDYTKIDRISQHRSEISNNLMLELVQRVDTSETTCEIIHHRFLGEWLNEYPSYIRSLIMTMDNNESIEDLMFKFYDDIGYKYLNFTTRDNLSAIIHDELELTEEIVKEHFKEYNIVKNIYYLLYFEYYIYYLKDLCNDYLNNNNISLIDACYSVVITSIDLNEGLVEYIDLGIASFTAIKIRHLSAILSILTDSQYIINLTNPLYGLGKTYLHIQPIVFDKFRVVPLYRLIYPNENRTITQIFRYFKVDLVKTKEDVSLNLCNRFFYKSFQDTIGLHNVWYSNLWPRLTKRLNDMVTLNMMAPLNYIVTGVDKYGLQNTEFFAYYRYFTLAYMNTIKYENNPFPNRDDASVFETIFSILESCRIMTDDYYNFYKGLYDVECLDLCKCLEEHFSLKELSEFLFGKFLVNNTIEKEASDLYWELSRRIDSKKPYHPDRLGRIWVDPLLQITKDTVERLQDGDLYTSYPLKSYESEWYSVKVRKVFEKAALDSLWHWYKLKMDEKALFNEVRISEIYDSYLNCPKDSDIYLYNTSDNLILRILTIYLLMIPQEERSYINIEMKKRLMKMSLGIQH